jgi:hypothetical protein
MSPPNGAVMTTWDIRTRACRPANMPRRALYRERSAFEPRCGTGASANAS